MPWAGDLGKWIAFHRNHRNHTTFDAINGNHEAFLLLTCSSPILLACAIRKKSIEMFSCLVFPVQEKGLLLSDVRILGGQLPAAVPGSKLLIYREDTKTIPINPYEFHDEIGYDRTPILILQPLGWLWHICMSKHHARFERSYGSYGLIKARVRISQEG